MDDKPQVLTPKTAEALTAEAASLRQAVEAANARGARKDMVLTILGVVAVALIAGLTTIAVQLNVAIGQATETSKRVADCTTAGGKCYAEGQKRTGAAVGDISKTQLYIVECARALPVDKYPPGPTFDKLFEECVKGRLRPPQATP
jgi:hypothetical protein